ncbi:alpha/beta fold hydrolase [Pseudonocardia asaccharolytica]|uniref:Alpha/beta hydrolase n=1 Tax=Pseudonocardia asaccharolytica DSM 44247 = NBRC 16224 TaxID=1123024 RepID=A0A511D147_9PSEU|nr:alpha/beta fold hydrolase [Pseudonocardia asaccharolytica]GEL18491.1 alpha/beta hydrolase [Pseudonocardia asaccharolytica DSM 44247 = NBRC 16224]
MTTTATSEVSERIVEVGKIRARVLVAGTGDPVLFLHGAGGLFWDPFLDALAAGHTVYAVEHPGGGDSDALTHLPGIWELVLFYDELLDVLGLDTVQVVGHSFGGMVAAELASNSPRRVTRLVLVAPIGFWRDDTPIPDIAGIPPDSLPGLVLADPTSPLAAMLTPPADDPQALFEAAMRMASILHFIWPIPDKGLERRIHRVSAPTLLIWGAQDKLVDPVYAEEFRSRLRDSRLEIIDGAGHLPQLEAPDAVRAHVLGFLS